LSNDSLQPSALVLATYLLRHAIGLITTHLAPALPAAESIAIFAVLYRR